MPKSNIVELNKDTPSVQYLCKKCKRLAKVIEMVGPVSYTHLTLPTTERV